MTDTNVSIDCGWGNILIAPTFDSSNSLVDELASEDEGRRDIAFYVDNPHVVLALSPQKLFLDPSDTLRLDLDDYERAECPAGIVIERVDSVEEATAINNLYRVCNMVPSQDHFIWRHRESKKLIYLIARDESSGDVIGTVMGIDHFECFGDEQAGSSLWCLAVDPQAKQPGIGAALVNALALYFKMMKRKTMDLSVIHDNHQAIGLYQKMGFRAIRLFAVKNKNAFNEALFIGPDLDETLDPYNQIIVDEARARGISVEVLDPRDGYFVLSRGGKSVTCRGSLTELTSAVAMSRCQNKLVTHQWLRRANLRTPAFLLAGDPQQHQAFLARHKVLVVKPSTGEQGKGITVGITDIDELEKAIEKAQRYGEQVLIESFHAGEDLRIIVINGEVVAAATRKPPQIVGDGQRTVEELIHIQSRRRMAATDGESKIPVDSETERCLGDFGYRLDSVIPAGESITVRRTANVHTGGTIHDVTEQLHPRLKQAAIDAAQHLDIPVVGLDFIVEAPDREHYIIIEANERAGLANHEPQPTAQKFIDLLFPLSAAVPLRHHPLAVAS